MFEKSLVRKKILLSMGGQKFLLPFFSRPWPKYEIKLNFSERKKKIFPKCPETSEEAKIFFTLFCWARAWRKMFSGTEAIL